MTTKSSIPAGSGGQIRQRRGDVHLPLLLQRLSPRGCSGSVQTRHHARYATLRRICWRWYGWAACLLSAGGVLPSRR